MIYPKIGIRPVIDGRQFGVREDLEQQTMDMAYAAQKLIESRLRYPDGNKGAVRHRPENHWRRGRDL